MNNGSPAYKAVFFALAGLLLFTSVAPESVTGSFNAIRLLKVASSGGGKAKGKTTLPSQPAPTAPTTTTPTTGTTTPTGSTTGAIYPELSMISSNFDVNSELVPSWGTGQIPGLNPGNYEGAFRFICNAGQLSYDDPIVYPGQPGKAHLHQFFGNTGANAYSNYNSLRTTGSSTCMSPVNRSAYWMPAMLNGRGQVVRPDYVSIYYKRPPTGSPACTSMGTACVPIPNGLRYVFGFDMANNTNGTESRFYFNCDGPGATPGHYPDIVTAAQNCPVGARLGAMIGAPLCWDGKNVDSPDHRSHMAYGSYGWWGTYKCPETHQYIIPQFTMAAWYTVDETLDRSGTWEAGKTVTWSLSSDNMPGQTPRKPGTTMHADWWGAWDNNVQAMWHQNCIDKMLDCSGGDLGNGKQIKMFSGFSWNANPRLVPVPTA